MRTSTPKAHASPTLITALTALIVALCVPTVSLAAEAPIKEIPTNQFDNGFEFPKAVMVDNYPSSPEHGDVYVVDFGNHRVQVLSSTGVFVEMFGWGVNATKDSEPLATQTEKNVCTAASKDQCQAGVEGTAAGQLDEPFDIAVDPVGGDVYLAEQVPANGGSGARVQEFTAAGRFVLEIGREVNHTTKANLCSAEEAEKGVECAGPAQMVPGSSENGAFNFEFRTHVLAAGGKTDLLYVGDEHRMQEFDTSGKWVGEIPLGSISAEPGNRVQNLTLDQETGDLYLVYPNGGVVRELDSEGNELASLPVGTGEVFVDGLAVDSTGKLAVAAQVNGQTIGALYQAVSGRRISSFAIPSGLFVNGIALNDEGDLYIAGENAGSEGQVLVYTAKPVAELAVSPAICAPTLGGEASVVFDCTLNGEVDPEGVAETEALFEWGATAALGETTIAQKVEEPKTVQAVVGVPPNETLHYQLAGYDQNVKTPERLLSEQAWVVTPSVPPRVLSLSASHESSSSTVLSGVLNPENTTTTYEFQYAKTCRAGEPCPPIAQASSMVQTLGVSSAHYGRIGTVTEASGLAAATVYRYQLIAVNEKDETALDEAGGTLLPEGTFATAPAPSPHTRTGTVSAIESSSATITGIVNPDGASATYSFELGVYEGAATQYGIVSSGPAGAGTASLEETFGLSGLQPGTTYAYRIAITSGYIDNPEKTLRGTPVLFTTTGLPSVLTPPPVSPLLTPPNITFPTTTPNNSNKPYPVPHCRHGYTLDKRHACVKLKTHSKTRRHNTRQKKGAHPGKYSG